MVRFVVMEGIYLDDKKSFGFYNTVSDQFISLNGCHSFDSVQEFREYYIIECGYDFDRLNALIPNSWYVYEFKTDLPI